MAKNKKDHWVFRIHVLDRAGALTSIASAFSNEGINIDTVVGHGVVEKTTSEGSIVITFWGSENDKEVMVRKINRLSKVIRLEEKPYDSHHLRKSILILTRRRLSPKDVAGEKTFLTCELVNEEGAGFTFFLAGAPNELDPVLERLKAEGVVRDIVYSLVGI